LVLILFAFAREAPGRQFGVGQTANPALDRRNQYGNLLLIRCRLHKFELSMQLLIADYISQPAFAGVTIARRSLAAACAVGYLFSEA
jgi:hypothetical protein